MAPDLEPAACAACGGSGFRTLIDFGNSPLADRLMPADTDPAEDPVWPLRLVACDGCGLPQLASQPPPDMLFGGAYPYLSSVSSLWREHAERLAEAMVRRLDLRAEDLVVEIASNDGGQLAPFARRGIWVHGVEPSPLPAAEARRRGIDTSELFFDRAAAGRLARDLGTARLVIANNVVAHVPNPHDMLQGIADLMAPDALGIVETGYFGAMVETGIFDTIYHQHRCYFTLGAFEVLAGRSGLRVIDAERLATQGGSLRVFLAREDGGVAASERLRSLRAAEVSAGLLDGDCHDAYAATIRRRCAEIGALFDACVGRGWKIGAYGAAAKGQTLIGACGIDARALSYVVDNNPVKQGLRMPGMALPIVARDALVNAPVDALLVLAWNLIDEIADDLRSLRTPPRLICPLPEPRLV